MITNTAPKQLSELTESVKRLKQRLSEQNLQNDRVVQLRAGTKQATCDHTDPNNRSNVDEWISRCGPPTRIEGNYGVYAGDGLLLVDIDDYDGSECPSELNRLPETFTIKTPHGGEHRYFHTPANITEKIEEYCGSKNPRMNWGEVRSHHQYVVGPGSQLDGCNKEWCSDCSDSDKGLYTIAKDKPIARLDPETLCDILDEVADRSGTTDDRTKTRGEKLASHTLEEEHECSEDYDPIPQEYDTNQWIDKHALPRDDTLRNLWDGNYAAEGYQDDRSQAEYALVSKLTFWLGPHKGRVRQQMDRASPKKWDERGESYRESQLKAVDEQDEFYSGGHSISTPGTHSIKDPTIDSDSEITRKEARQRTQEVLKDAFESGEEVLVEALPTLGKSYGSVKAAAKTGLPVTILTARRDLYDDVRDWCDEHGLIAYQLPAMTKSCPTYTENPETVMEQRLVDLYERGATPSEIHDRLDGLPCQADGECPSLKKWDFELDEYDVLVGHYTQAKVTPIIDDRVVVLDECPDGVFDVAITDNLGSSISEFLRRLKEQADLPESTPTNYPELYNEGVDSEVGRQLQSQIERVVTERDTWDFENTFDGLTESNHGQAHRRAPEATYAVLSDGTEVNGYERVTMDDGTVLLHDTEELAVHIRDPPSFENAHAVVCLDGTPVERLWESSLGFSFDEDWHITVLDRAERQSYVVDVQEWEFIQTTDEFVYNYTQRKNVNVQKSAAFVEAVRQKHDSNPSVISTKACLDLLSREGVIDENTSSRHYGNLKSSNDFSDHELGIVLGSHHYPRSWVKRETAFVGETIDPQGHGVDKTYNSDYGNALLRHMREHEVLQAAMRFGRDEDTEARVYIHTACLPGWIPRTIRTAEIRTFGNATRGDVVQVLAETESPWTIGEIEQDRRVDVSERQVGNILRKFCEAGVLGRDESTRPHKYYINDISLMGEYGLVTGL